MDIYFAGKIFYCRGPDKVPCILLALRQNQANLPISQKSISLYNSEGFPTYVSYSQISYDTFDIPDLLVQKFDESKMLLGLKGKN